MKKAKNGVALGMCSLVLVGSLTGCAGYSRIEDENYLVGENENTPTSVVSRYSNLSDNEIQTLPSSIEEINITQCPYVTNLDTLPETCPNITTIRIDSCSGITNFDFVYRLHRLKKISFNECVGITPELLQYLEDHNIEYHIEDEDYQANLMVDDIINEIITDDMTDEEKVRAITLYVSRHCDYHITDVVESNHNPLTETLLEGKGVCAGYAYTTNVLLRKAGINSFEVKNSSHVWNLIEIDGKYYYLDVTNVGGGFILNELTRPLLEHFGIGLYYLTDPEVTIFTAEQKPETLQTFPQELLEDIQRGESEKNLIEKYGTSVPVRVIEGFLALAGVTMAINKITDAKEEITTRRQNRNKFANKKKKNGNRKIDFSKLKNRRIERMKRKMNKKRSNTSNRYNRYSTSGIKSRRR